MKATLDIIIVNWNTGKSLEACLDSIAAAGKEHVELQRVVVVDNASGDGSADCLADLDLPATLIKNGENLGFAKACNQGAAGSSADFLLFLNPDTRLFPNSLDSVIQFFLKESSKDIGIVGIQLKDDTGNIARSCARFPRLSSFIVKMFHLDRINARIFPSYVMTGWNHATSAEVDHVIGAFYLVRRHLFLQLKGFDETYFAYLEDMDFSLRAREAGWKIYYYAEAQAYHMGGGSSKADEAFKLSCALQSRIIYAFEHLSSLDTMTILACTLIFEPIIRLLQGVLSLSKSRLVTAVEAYLDLYRSTPSLLRRIDMRKKQWMSPK